MSARNLVALGFGVLGFLIAGPAGFSFGFTLGGLIGALLFPNDPIKGPRVNDLEVQISTYGAAIPIAYGSVRIAGNLIWARDIFEDEDSEKVSIGQEEITYEYFAWFSVMFCEGPVVFKRVWADSKLIWGYDAERKKFISGYTNYMTFIEGHGDEYPSAMMEAVEGVGNVPSYKGLARIDFARLPLANFGNRIPNINVELVAGDICTHPWAYQAQERYGRKMMSGHRFELMPSGKEAYDSYSYDWWCFSKTRREIYYYFGTVTDDRDAYGNPTETYPLTDWIVSRDAIWVYNLDSVAEVGFHDLSGKISAYAQSHGYPGYYLYEIYQIRHCEGSNFIVLMGNAITESSVYPYNDGTFNCVIDLDTNTIVGMTDLYNLNYVDHYWAIMKPIVVTQAGEKCWYNITDRDTDLWSVWRIDETGAMETVMEEEPVPFSSYTSVSKMVMGEEREGETDLYAWTSTTILKAVIPFTWDDPVVTTFKSGLTGVQAVSYNSETNEVIVSSSSTGTADDCIRVYNATTGILVKTIPYPGGGFIQSSTLNTWHEYLEGPNNGYKFPVFGIFNGVSPNFRWYIVDVEASEIELWSSLTVPEQGGFRDAENCTSYLIDYDGAFRESDDPDLPPYYRGDWVNVTYYRKFNIETEGIPLVDIVRDINERSGLYEGVDFDVSDLEGTVQGYFANKEATGRALLEPLMSVYHFDGIEANGVLTYRHRNRASIATVSEGDLGSGGGGSRTPQPRLVERRTQELEMPAEITVKYVAKELDYNQNAQKARRAFETQKAEQRVSIDVPITMIDADAKLAAEVILLASWYGRTHYEFSLPRKYIEYDPGDVLTIQYQGVDHQVYIETVDYGGDGLIRMSGRSHDPTAYEGIGLEAEVPNYVPAALEEASPMVVHFIDGPLLDPDFDMNGGFYVVGEGEDQTVAWPGGQIFSSSDDLTFAAGISVGSEAVIGTCSTVLGDFATHCVIDRENTLTVVIDRGTLASVTFLDMMSGFNYAMVGDELIQFQDVELVSSSPITYTLRNLVRGLQGTEWAMSEHGASERFIKLTTTTVYKNTMLSAERNLPKYWKGVTVGELVEDIASFSFTPKFNHWKPIAPAHLRAERDGGDNITLTWDRRARLNFEWQDDVEVPLDESSESYEIDIMDGVTVVRTITASATSCTYSAANQTTDFGFPQSSLVVRVYQMSSRVGRGYVCERTV